MIKNLLIAGAIATAPITINNAITTNTIDINYNLDNYTQAYTNIDYDANNEIETAVYIKLKGTEKNQITNGICNFKQFIANEQGIYNAEHTYIQRLYIVTEYINTALNTESVLFKFLGDINAYVNTDYDTITVYSRYKTTAPTQNITNALNKNFPTNYTDANTLIQDIASNITTGTDQQTLQPTQVNQLNKMYYTAYDQTAFTQTIYSYMQVTIVYNDLYPKTTPFIDLTYYPTTARATVVYNSNATATEQIVDIPGLMFEILGMPFAFLSTAFNLTIFPGTNYAINISHILMALIIAGIVIFIIKKIFK